MTIKLLGILFTIFLIMKVNYVDANNNINQVDNDHFLDNDDFIPHKYDENENFDWRLLKAVLAEKSTNTVISPFSIKLLLVLLLEVAGPSSPTQRELQFILSQLKSSPLIREYYRNILNSFCEPKIEYELKIGTKIIANYNVDTRQKYAAIIQAHYRAEISKLDFRKTAESVNAINNWCLNVTNGHIKEIIRSDDLQDAVMLLLNTIYFKGHWRSAFPLNGTVAEPFFTTPSTQIRAQYMTQNGVFYFLNSDTYHAKILRLPYRGKKFSMYVILPHAKGGLDELLDEFNGNALKNIQWLMHESRVQVSIPKFKFEHTLHLKDSLQSLGIYQIFSDSASLPGLTKGTGLKVSNVIQRTGIIVDESGTTAYASSDTSVDSRFGDEDEEFKANRPFAFIIEDETTGCILLAGKVTDPTK